MSKSKSKSKSNSKSKPKPKSKSDNYKYCHCKPTCGKWISARTRRDHYSQIPDPTTIEPSESGDDTQSEPEDSPSEMELDEHPDHAQIVEFSDEVGQISPEEIPMEVDHLSDNDLSSVGSDSENDYGGLELDELEANEWADFDEEADYDIPISREEMVRELEEMLDADEEGALWDNRNGILTEQDRDNISAFQLKMISNMPRVAFEQMRHAFRHKLDISSHWVMIHRVAILSRIEPQ
ncbi:hypothetical protein MSAN_01894200 [Mycena sanguinolenta]|uniref:Uncharacterized protein n=1 Tax=Mycena sanguinolenta TaxID=230812 RepID=A0A8H6XR21_9AGAR|nr:hypothetical protein MSAN_01894200 [Mycena sanguinolenta]